MLYKSHYYLLLFKSPRKLRFRGYNSHNFVKNSQFVPFPPEIPCFQQLNSGKSPRVAHFPQLSSKMGEGPQSSRFPLLFELFAHAYAWASFHFELWEGQSVSKVFAWVQGAGPLVVVSLGGSTHRVYEYTYMDIIYMSKLNFCLGRFSSGDLIIWYSFKIQAKLAKNYS